MRTKPSLKDSFLKNSIAFLVIGMAYSAGKADTIWPSSSPPAVLAYITGIGLAYATLVALVNWLHARSLRRIEDEPIAILNLVVTNRPKPKE